MDRFTPAAAHPGKLELLAQLLKDPRGMRDLAGALRSLALALEAVAAPAQPPAAPRRDPGLPGY